MRKISATVSAIAFGLAFTGGPAFADTASPAPTDPCTGPTTSSVDATQIVHLTQQVGALEGQNQALAFELRNDAWRLHRRYHKIHRQAREIRHLKAELRAASAH